MSNLPGPALPGGAGAMRVIFNADDLGDSRAINQAIVQAHRQGVLTSASLMVAGEAAEEAVALAREHPSLAVGLHVVMVDGRPALPPHEIPHLVGPDGRFPQDAVALGLRCFFSRTAQAELAAEIEAQFRLYAQTGLPLDHVDGHYHLHLHPSALRVILPLARRYGARGFRLPRDELLPALAWSRRQAGTQVTWAAIFALLNRYVLRKLRPFPLATTERVYGLFHSGRMEEEYVVRLLKGMRVSSAEFYLHPSTQPPQKAFGPNPGDLETLLSPRLREVVAERGITLCTYSTLAEEKEGL